MRLVHVAHLLIRTERRLVGGCEFAILLIALRPALGSALFRHIDISDFVRMITVVGGGIRVMEMLMYMFMRMLSVRTQRGLGVGRHRIIMWRGAEALALLLINRTHRVVQAAQ